MRWKTLSSLSLVWPTLYLVPGCRFSIVCVRLARRQKKTLLSTFIRFRCLPSYFPLISFDIGICSFRAVSLPCQKPRRAYRGCLFCPLGCRSLDFFVPGQSILPVSRLFSSRKRLWFRHLEGVSRSGLLSFPAANLPFSHQYEHFPVVQSYVPIRCISLFTRAGPASRLPVSMSLSYDLGSLLRFE